MNTIAIYGLQASMGLLAVAAGTAKLCGVDVMVDAFDVLGLGAPIRMTAGMVEVIGGLCLLLPRAGAVGALLVAAVVVGSAGLTLGQIASRPVAHAAVQTHQAVGQVAVGHVGEFKFQQPAAIKYRDGIDI